MFSNYLSDNYVTKRFILKGTEEELREILDNSEYDCTLIGDIEATRDYLFQMELDEYSEIGEMAIRFMLSFQIMESQALQMLKR